MPSRQSDSTEPTEENAGVFLSTRKRKEAPRRPCLASVATEPRKVPVTGQEDDLEPPRDRMPLKKSSIVQEIYVTRGQERSLRRLLEEQPDLFEALLKLVNSKGEGVTDQQRHELRRRLVVARDHSPLPWVKPVLEAAFRLVGDGICLVDPLAARTPEDAERIEQVDELLKQQRRKRMARFLKGDDLEGDGKGKGGGRLL
jgi:hypothetical protein